MHPLPHQHPEFQRLELASGVIEYRVGNWTVAKDGSGNLMTNSSLSKVDLVFVAAILLTARLFALKVVYEFWAVVLAIFIYSKSQRILWESLIVVQSHGFQLETWRGFPNIPLWSSRRFLPLSDFQGILINEGFYGWETRYYLVLAYGTEATGTRLHVVFENILPRLPVLVEIYRELQPSERPSV
ncbi:hypothetical protein SISNIDRAFT_447920 [Sistotremastrum niveocremeum HHB9708]|uniref:Phosphatidylinositol N-acetylglucosaminyltransferase subunit H conserved domain-containing protein n=1 Tax=Sistotremastrum niveocremeum HHB9708 TaxID=1314777 RepID=A0A165AIX3_9AGAM|nr:hypothetical protein SISNIDRAFT_447920 [Sistotremastrum niveocremeum HHB9708]